MRIDGSTLSGVTRLALCGVFATAPIVAGCGDSGEPTRVAGAALAIESALDPAIPRVGENRIELRLEDANGRPVERAEIVVTVMMPAMGAMPAMGGEVPVRELGGGGYAAEFELSMTGSWRVAIDARTPTGERLGAEGSLAVGNAGLRLTSRPSAEAPEPEAGAPREAPPVELSLDPARLQEVGVRSVAAARSHVARTVRALGVVTFDESALTDVSLKVRGWVRTLAIDAVGAEVERGQVLFTVYSPELYTAQREYLQALAGRAGSHAAAGPPRDWRADAARRRLELWDVAPAEIAALEAGGAPREELPIRAPVSGFVVEKEVVAGGVVEPGMRLLRIAPLDRVWIEAELYEQDAALAHTNVSVELTLAALPGRSFSGRVASILPALSPEARTLRVRIALENPDLALRPGMWASVLLRGEAAERVVIPEAAVLRTGERSFVFLDLGGGRFRPRAVELGAQSGEQIEVRSGLEPGERVVASGMFLIAAESRLRTGMEAW